MKSRGRVEVDVDEDGWVYEYYSKLLSVFLFDIYINIYIASEQANRYHFGSV